MWDSERLSNTTCGGGRGIHVCFVVILLSFKFNEKSLDRRIANLLNYPCTYWTICIILHVLQMPMIHDCICRVIMDYATMIQPFFPPFVHFTNTFFIFHRLPYRGKGEVKKRMK